MEPKYCTQCGQALTGRFCTTCGKDALETSQNPSRSTTSPYGGDSTLSEDFHQPSALDHSVSSPKGSQQTSPRPAFRHLEITTLDVAPDLAANKDSLMLHATMELEMYVKVNLGATQPWTSAHRSETVAIMMGRGKIPGNWTPLAFEFPQGPAELFVCPTPKSLQALKTLVLQSEPIWKRRWTTEQTNAFAAGIVQEMGFRYSLSSDKQSIRIALCMSLNRLVPHEV